jgi:hypothetical protein
MAPPGVAGPTGNSEQDLGYRRRSQERRMSEEDKRAAAVNPMVI